MAETLTETPRDLDQVLWSAFALLARGVSDRRSAMHTPALVTLGTDGWPAARTVVLRGFDAASRRLTFHSDGRSRKIAELERNPRVAVLFYDARAKVQVRCRGEAEIHRGDEIARLAWQRLALFSRRAYVGEAPGEERSAPTSGLPMHLDNRAPSPEEAEPGFASFAVVSVRLRQLEWLYLAATGHQRALFRWCPESDRFACWLTP
jgi:pyridoxamine 5'-phosphate oxidase